MLLTTHYMFEADELCDRIAVIAKGEIVAQGTPQELKARVEKAASSRSRCSASTRSRRRGRGAAGRASVAVEEREQEQLLIVQRRAGGS